MNGEYLSLSAKPSLVFMPWHLSQRSLPLFLLIRPVFQPSFFVYVVISYPLFSLLRSHVQSLSFFQILEGRTSHSVGSSDPSNWKSYASSRFYLYVSSDMFHILFCYLCGNLIFPSQGDGQSHYHFLFQLQGLVESYTFYKLSTLG